MAEYKAASIWIGVRDSKNQRVEPAILDLATSYIFEVGVINRTETTGGHRWAAMLEVGLGISLDSMDILPYTVYPPREFAPDEVVEYASTAYIPREWAGMSGLVIARVFDPFGNLLASGEKPFSIGHKISPEAKYQVPGDELPFLSPDETSEGKVVLAGVGSRPPPSQPAPPKPKVAPIQGTKEESPGISCPTLAAPSAKFEGEVVVGGRLG